MAKGRTTGMTVGIMMLTGGCTVDQEFAYRFDHCMESWKTQETRPDMTVKPKGQELTDYCFKWARYGTQRLVSGIK